MEKERRNGRRSAWQSVKAAARAVYNVRAVLLALPVIAGAIFLAVMNYNQLPAQVGLDMLASGEFQFFVDKGLAIIAPLVLTSLCLLLMFCSKKVFYPWLISIFSLLLPVILWLTNVFPV